MQHSSDLAPAFKLASPYDLEEAVESASDCARLCLETAAYCSAARTSSGVGVFSAALLACNKICQSAAESLVTPSALTPILCRACVDACEKLSSLLQPYQDDDQIQACVYIAQACVESGRIVLRQGVDEE